MKLELMDVLETMGEVWHIHATAVRPPFQNIERFDHGLRRFLNPDYDFVQFGQQLLDKMPQDTVVLTTDKLECRYLLFSLPDEPDCVYLCGPTRQGNLSESLSRHIQARYGEPTLQDILFYHKDVTLEGSNTLIVFLIRLIERLYPERNFACVSIPDFLPKQLDFKEFLLLNDDLRAQVWEKHRQERNLLEGQILSAVSMGDSKNALQALIEVHQNPVTVSLRNEIFRMRNHFNGFNALCRIGAAYSRSPNVVEIDKLYRLYAGKVSQITNWKEMNRLLTRMVSDYCQCVQQYSQGDYSPSILQITQYIQMHLDEPLSLRFFSQMCNLHPSYLSNLFHKETGMAMTEYINQYRMKRAAVLLRYSTLSISQISEQVGFLDEAYFSRIFKRLKGVTPSAYRKENNRPEME